MNTWPNWVDLVIVTLVLRGGYVGFSRGLITEFLNLLVAVSITLVTINYSSFAIAWVGQWLDWKNQTLKVFLIYWLFFLSLVLVGRWLLILIAGVIKWERVLGVFGAIGVILGALRGLWWSGLIVVTLASSGIQYAIDSVEDRSIAGPHLLKAASQAFTQASDWFPGAEHRTKTLVPPIKLEAKKRSSLRCVPAQAHNQLI